MRTETRAAVPRRTRTRALVLLLHALVATTAAAEDYGLSLAPDGTRRITPLTDALLVRLPATATDRVENGTFDASPTTGQLRAWTPRATSAGVVPSGSVAWAGTADSAGNPASGSARIRNTAPGSASGWSTYGIEQCVRPGVPVSAPSPSPASFFPSRFKVLIPPGQDPGAFSAAVEVMALFYATSDCSGSLLGGGGVGTPIGAAGTGGWLSVNPGWSSGTYDTYATARSVALRVQVYKDAGLALPVEAYVDDAGLRGTYVRAKGDLNRDGETDLLLRNNVSGEHQAWFLKDENRTGAADPAVAHVATEITYGPTASAPAPAQTGDLMVAGVLAQPAVVAPAGWTRIEAEIPCGPAAFRYYGSYWYRIRQAGDASWTWGHSVATQIAVYRNVDPAAPIVASRVALHGEPDAPPAWSIDLPSLTAGGAGDAAHYQSLGIYHSIFVPPPNYVDRAIGRADATTSGDRLGLAAGQVTGGTLTCVGNFDSGAHLHAILRAAQSGVAVLTPSVPSLDWQIGGVDDFNGDGEQDLLMWNSVSGAAEFWLLNGTARAGASVPLVGAPALPWKPAATADFDRDGQPDVVFRNAVTQQLVVWTLNGTAPSGQIVPTPSQAVDPNWEIVGAVDLNRDGYVDLLWYNATSGKLVYWLMDASVARIAGSFTNPANAGDSNWKVLATGDYGIGPGAAAQPDTRDVVWRNATSGRVVVWFMDASGTRTGGVFVTPDPFAPATNWTSAGPR